MGNSPLPKRHSSSVTRLPAERDGESEILRSALSEGLVEYLNEDVRTLHDMLRNTAEKYPDNKALGWRENDGPFRWMTYRQFYENAIRFGSGLIALGGVPKETMVGLYLKNRPEWVIAEHGSCAYAMPIVPLYDTLGPDACQYISNEAELQFIVCTSDHTESLLNNDIPSLKYVVQIGEISAEIKALSDEKGIQIITYEEVLNIGENDTMDPVPPEPKDIATLCYTSGTTGNPKGVMLTHGNFIALLAASKLCGVDLVPTDVHISYLPLAHVFERIVFTSVINSGCAAGFYRGDVLKLFEDIELLKPTLFPSVPRLYNRLYDKVMAKAMSGGLTQTLFETALSSKLESLKDGYVDHMIYDKIIFGKVKNKLGGRVRLMITGSAPISPDVLNFVRVAFSCPVVEGYGQTESTGALTITEVGDLTYGHVGYPIPCTEIKLVDVPEMEYLSTDEPNPRGEVCYRGTGTCLGYYKQPEKTAELIDEHGWYHTGDIGEILPDGKLKIVDRKKNIFKLAHGEYIAPEKLENIYVKSQFVLQNFVYGDSLKARLVAIVVPDPESLIPWAKARGIDTDNIEELCQNPEVIEAIHADMIEQGKRADVRGFERIAAISLVPEQFSVENDTLTPTFKLKRPQAREMYKDLIDNMYENID